MRNPDVTDDAAPAKHRVVGAGVIDARASPSPAAGSPSAPATSSSPAPLPLRERIAGLLIVGFRGSRLDQTAWLRTALRDGGLGGVILFDRDQLTGAQRNVLSPAQVKTLVRDLRAAAGKRPIIVGVDQEGGIVTRLSPAHGFPAVASEAEIGRSSVATAPGLGEGDRRRRSPTPGST